MRTRATALIPTALLVGALGLSACSSQEPAAPASPTAEAPTSAATGATNTASDAMTDATDAATSAADSVSDTVDINNASTEQISQTLRENGVPDPDRWAGEIEKLRDVNPAEAATRLRQQADQAGLNQETVQRLLGSLRF